MKRHRCQQFVGDTRCNLKPLGRLDGRLLCSQHLYAALAAKSRKAA